MLQSFKMSNNKLVGRLPADLAPLPLTDVYLGGNKLTGTIPRSFDSSASLEYLYLFDNDLSGLLPRELCTSSLTFFYASGNARLTCYEQCLGQIAHQDFTSILPECSPTSKYLFLICICQILLTNSLL